MTISTWSMVMATTPTYRYSNCFFPHHSRMAVLKKMSITNTTTKGVGSSSKPFQNVRKGRYIAKNSAHSIRQMPWMEEI